MTDTILFIVEGEKTEPSILKSIRSHFLQNKNLEIVSVCSNIYYLFKKISEDEIGSLDMLTLLKECSAMSDKERAKLENLTDESVSEIYLFFDYDGHDTQADDDTILKMLETFDNETELGKLYISYPMIEAYKDSWDIESQGLEFFQIKDGRKYKKQCADRCTKKLKNLAKLNKDDWGNQLIFHHKINHIIVDAVFKSLKYDVARDKLSVINTFQQQKQRFIDISQLVAIFSPLCQFLIDYKGKPLYDEWIKEESPII